MGGLDLLVLLGGGWWAMFSTYVISPVHNYFYPYDVLSVGLISAALYLIVSGSNIVGFLCYFEQGDGNIDSIFLFDVELVERAGLCIAFFDAGCSMCWCEDCVDIYIEFKWPYGFSLS